MRKIDPFYYLLRIILRSFFKSNLTEEERIIIEENIDKHRFVQWVNLAASILVVYGLSQASQEEISSLISILIAPVMVMGGAWFAISFGGIPEKLMLIAISTTRWMFIAFLVSLSTMFLGVLALTPYVLWPVFILIYVASLISYITYDTADSLKIGLDEFSLKHSRAALRYYKQKEGIDVDK